MRLPMEEKLRINSEYKNINFVSSKILHILKELNVDEEKKFKIRLCVEEALINAVKHGSNLRPEAKIKVDFEIDKEQFKISIEDEGNGFDYEHTPDPTFEEGINKLTGRGVFLIKNFMDKVCFNQKGSMITMIKKLGEVIQE
ncbi:MAG: ATP-binding protein [Candidatus Aureabacteria bacterium]|nr:ATP-binding protein [Candidatus Auribacterota bacterium]